MEKPVSTGSRLNRLRVIVFTAGPLTPINHVFFNRLVEDPLLEVRAIIVEEYQRLKEPLVFRISRGIREDGWPWLWFKFTSVIGTVIRKTAHCLFELVQRRKLLQESYETLTRESGIPVYHVLDIHSEQGLRLIRSLRPQLGAIVDGPVLHESVITISEYGTLSLRKGEVSEYSGGGPAGYWEVLAGEPSISVTIDYAASEVEAGDVLAKADIPIEECDTLESLQIKADIVGARLYHEAIKTVALGSRQAGLQGTSRRRTFRAPSEFKVWQLQKRLQQEAAKRMPGLRDRPSWGARTRVLAQYLLLLPWLVYLRNLLIKQQRAPICIFFYHVVANRPLNHMCCPLETFVQQIEFLRRYYAVISLDDAVERPRSGRNDEIVTAITFDDGYKANVWAIEYLRYFGIPACFFVSTGHVRDGRAFEHDLRRGFSDAEPMSETEVQRLASQGFVVGSHGVYHEDFGGLDAVTAGWVLWKSGQMVSEVAGRKPKHFSFPKGHVGKNITAETFTVAQQYYPYIYSAFGGYNFPVVNRRHFFRVGTPLDVLDMAMVMNGYTGFRECLAGNGWGLKTDAYLPDWARSSPTFIGPSRVATHSHIFGSTGDEPSLVSCDWIPEEVNGDRLPDQDCHFNAPAGGFQSGDTEGTHKGRKAETGPIL